MLKRMLSVLAVLAVSATMFGCTTARNQDAGIDCKEETLPGAAIGGVAGAVVGAILDGTTGGLAGGLAGVIVGGVVGDSREDQCFRDEIAKVRAERDELAAKLAACEAENADLKRQLEGMQGSGILARYTIGTDVLFAVGRDELTSDGKALLDAAVAEIQSKYPGKTINVEGHTDSDPIRHSRWKSNWELGAARALAVLHYLEDEKGVDGQALSATTFAYHKPVAGNDTDEGKAQNRRAAIVIYAQE